MDFDEQPLYGDLVRSLEISNTALSSLTSGLESSESDNCDSFQLRKPGLCFSKSTNGTVVTWSKNSLEANVVDIRNYVRDSIRAVSLVRASGKSNSFFLCLACYRFFPLSLEANLSILADHLASEDERLSKVLRALLDTRQLDPGK
jgi:hypothetical protein